MPASGIPGSCFECSPLSSDLDCFLEAFCRWAGLSGMVLNTLRNGILQGKHHIPEVIWACLGPLRQ